MKRHDDQQFLIDFSDEPLTNFNARRERIGRQTSVVYPVRNVYGETRRHELADDIRSGASRYADVGVRDVIHRSPAEAAAIAMIVAKLKYGARHAQYHDLGTGLYSALTRPSSGIQFHDVQHLRNDSGQIKKTAVTISREGLEKIVFGPLVNDQARAVTGAGPVVKELRKSFHSVLYGAEPEPFAAASVMTERGQIVIHGRPITVNKFHGDVFLIELDNAFFPLIQNADGELRARNEPYIHSVAGLYGVWAFGAWLQKQRGDTGIPQAPDAHKTLLYLQAASEVRTFAPSVVQKQGNGRYNFTFRRMPTVRELRPSCVSSEGYVRYAEFSRFISGVGRAYLAAIQKLGILNDLHPHVLIPATDKGAQFPPENDEIVYVKAEQVENYQK